MADLPMELIADILSRLPVKPLLRFRCVSKPWNALIQSQDFVKSHLKRSLETQNHFSLILRTHWLYAVRLYSVGLDCLAYGLELDHPLKSDRVETEVLGSCHGLLCLHNGEKDIGIWNPSTREFHKLLPAKIEFPEYSSRYDCIIYGFGYDPRTDDYKVVSFVQFHAKDDWDSSYSEVMVYSMRSSSWRRIQDFPYHHRYDTGYGVLVGSALHWVVTRKAKSDTANLIASFDLTVEEYGLVPQPDFTDDDFDMNLRELGGCLCIVSNYFNVRVDVWVMKVYGVKESWSKMISVAQGEVMRSFAFAVPLTCSKSGCEVLLVVDNRKLFWYDLEHKTVKRLKNILICGVPDYFETLICVESLVRLSGGNGANQDRKGKKNQKKKRKKRDDFLPVESNEAVTIS